MGTILIIFLVVSHKQSLDLSNELKLLFVTHEKNVFEPLCGSNIWRIGKIDIKMSLHAFTYDSIPPTIEYSTRFNLRYKSNLETRFSWEEFSSRNK